MLLVGLGVGTRLWAALQWRTNFDSDEAIFGLMAKHLLEGQYTATVYGTNHLGSIESILAAPLIASLGDSVPVLRLAPVALFCLFLILHYQLVRRQWGRSVALLSLVILGVPGFYMLSWTYQPIGAYNALLALGTLYAYLLFTHKPQQAPQMIWLGLLGLVLGLGMWANQMFVVYAFSLAAVELPSTRAWERTRGVLARLWQRMVELPFDEFVPLTSAGLFGLGVLAFFSAGCDPTWQYEDVQLLSRVGLAAVGLSAIGLMIAYADDRGAWIKGLVALVAGGGIGFAPQWLPWLASGAAPEFTIRPSCPVGVFGRLELLTVDLLPAVVGLPPSQAISRLPVTLVGFSLALGALAAAAALWFLWRSRKALWRLLSLRPAREQDRAILFWVLIFMVPIVLSALASNTADLGSARHLLVTWQGFSVVFAVAVVTAARRFGRIVLIMGVVWVVLVGAWNLAITPKSWNVKFTRYPPSQVEQLVGELNELGVAHAFADYWGAYTLTYLTDENLVVAPYNGLNRYPSYLDRALGADTVAVLLPASRAPRGDSRFDTLESYLDREHVESGEGPARGNIVEHLASGEIIERVTIGPWDVWVIADLLGGG